jgi:hypothetical protein
MRILFVDPESLKVPVFVNRFNPTRFLRMLLYRGLGFPPFPPPEGEELEVLGEEVEEEVLEVLGEEEVLETLGEEEVLEALGEEDVEKDVEEDMKRMEMGISLEIQTHFWKRGLIM